jgi:hypothetical protein
LNPLETIAVIENFDYYSEADLCQQESWRGVYFPADLHDYELYPVDISTTDLANSQETTFAVYITGTTVNGAPASVPFNLELYLNYEVSAAPGSILQGMGSVSYDRTYPEDVIYELKVRPELVTQAYRDTEQIHSHNVSIIKDASISMEIKAKQALEIAQGSKLRYY